MESMKLGIGSRAVLAAGSFPCRKMCAFRGIGAGAPHTAAKAKYKVSDPGLTERSAGSFRMQRTHQQENAG